MGAVQATVHSCRRFLSWWGQELVELLPSALLRWVIADGQRTIIAVDGERLLVQRESGGRLGPSGELDPAVARAIAANGRVGIRLPPGACLIRRVELPASARADFHRILILDLERATPFRRQDIHCDHFVEEGAAHDGKVWARQIAVKRAVLDPIVGRLRALGITVDFADCWDDAGERGLPIDLLRHDESRPGTARERRSRLLLILASATIVLSGTAIAIGLSKYESARHRLEAETELAKAKALAVRRSLTSLDASLAEIAALRRLKAAKPPVIGILDELSRLLPDGVWISAFKLEGTTLDVTVVAPTTTELLGLFARSALFTAADLTAPVVYDPAGKAERATIRLSVKSAAPSGTTTAGGQDDKRGRI